MNREGGGTHLQSACFTWAAKRKVVDGSRTQRGRQLASKEVYR